MHFKSFKTSMCLWAGLAVVAVGIAIFWTAQLAARQGQDLSDTGAMMPEFTSASPGLWLNSKPLTRAELKGNVLLLEIWTSI